MFRIDDGQTKMMIKDGSKREVTDGYDTSYLTKEQAKDININTFRIFIIIITLFHNINSMTY